MFVWKGRGSIGGTHPPAGCSLRSKPKSDALIAGVLAPVGVGLEGEAVERHEAVALVACGCAVGSEAFVPYAVNIPAVLCTPVVFEHAVADKVVTTPRFFDKFAQTFVHQVLNSGGAGYIGGAGAAAYDVHQACGGIAVDGCGTTE